MNPAELLEQVRVNSGLTQEELASLVLRTLDFTW